MMPVKAIADNQNFHSFPFLFERSADTLYSPVIRLFFVIFTERCRILAISDMSRQTIHQTGLTDNVLHGEVIGLLIIN